MKINLVPLDRFNNHFVELFAESSAEDCQRESLLALLKESNIDYSEVAADNLKGIRFNLKVKD